MSNLYSTEDDKNPPLFDKDEFDLCKREWKGMPEFVQGKQKPYAQIIFRFGSEEDLQEFAKLIGQKLTKRTKSAWHPQIVRGLDASKRWVDES
jgi:hypothetical protein